MTVIEVALTTWTSAAGTGTAPKATLGFAAPGPASKPLPVIVTAVPPAALPKSGLSELTTGRRAGCEASEQRSDARPGPPVAGFVTFGVPRPGREVVAGRAGKAPPLTPNMSLSPSLMSLKERA